MIGLAERKRAVPAEAGLVARGRLTIGLLNNMPDAAMALAERQFGDLLTAAAGGAEVELRLFALPEVARGERARTAMKGRYQSAEALGTAGLDGLIVTGVEPRTPELTDEPYWPGLAKVIDWTREAAMPTVWSCLAAHAAVLRLDGIKRRPLPVKLSGVFQSEVVDDATMIGPAPMITPHSRQNGLWADDLLARGYRILAHSLDAGVEAFVRPGPCVSLFLQGHPEYDGDTLMLEYQRDVTRFLRGERPSHPQAPAGYFDPRTEAALAAIAADARRRPTPTLAPRYAAALLDAAPAVTWRDSAVRLYRGWLGQFAGRSPAARHGFGRFAS